MDDRDQLLEGLQALLQHLLDLTETDELAKPAELDLSMTQVRTLLVLKNAHRPLPVHGVAAELRLSEATACRSIDCLVRTGNVERRESPEDRRVKLVSITDQGLALIDRHLEPKRAAIRAFVGELPDEEARTFGAFLQHLRASGHLGASEERPLVGAGGAHH